jgi:hypothetical protein
VKRLELVGYPTNEIFHPHGISFFETESGEQLLFVVDHRKTEFVDIFEYKDNQL